MKQRHQRLFFVGTALVMGACARTSAPVCPTTAETQVPASAPAPASAKRTSISVDDVAKQLVAAYNARDDKRSFGLMNASMQALLPLEKEAAWIDGMLSRGALVETKRVGGEDASHGIYELKAERGVFRVDLHIDGEGKISGLQVKERKVEPPVVQTSLTLSLPFRDEWSVAWGGDTLELNAHVSNPNQRRAADLVKVDAEGKERSGDGSKDSDYFAFGAPILAVADGTVTAVTDGVHDNAPGESNPYAAVGNTVTILHEGNVYSVYAHLQNHSIKVKEGAKVKRGTVLAACGNSGQSSRPHLHFQLQDGPNVDSSWGVEAVFPEVTLTRDGRTSRAKGYTFFRNDRIQAPR